MQPWEYGDEPECGVFESLSFQEYGDLSALNASSLKAGLFRDGVVSTKHMLAALTGQMKSDSDAMRFGTAAHTVIFEGWSAFRAATHVQGPCVGIKKDGHQCSIQRGTWMLDNRWYCKTHAPDGALRPDNCVEPDAIERLVAMNDAIAESEACDLIRDVAINELTCVWDSNGARMKARLDRFSPGIITDLKSAEVGKVDRHSVQSSIRRYGWHIQCAVYLEAARECMGHSPLFRWVFVEKNPPFDVSVWYASEKMIEWGNRDLKLLRDEFVDSLETGIFLGACPSAGEVDPPPDVSNVGPITLGGTVVLGG